MSIYNFSVTRINGEQDNLANYKDQVILIVNTASECGFTPQFGELQSLYEKYKDKGFTILGFPSNQFGKQDPGSNDEISEFCEINYGVNFPMFEKTEVKGPDANPLFKYLVNEAKGTFGDQIKWNFTKFLVNRNGEVIERFAPQTKGDKLDAAIEAAL
ncbi:MAG TPA: glutathione peroxidase [Pseudogracilibacillus sp.]|nr:glutathione peroxidase [Pseudogracilibacillus sp.]